METRSTDAQGRICLPEAFANTTVILDQVSETEIRIRKAEIALEGETRFREESPAPPSNRDRDLFLELLDHPPAPTSALKLAAARHDRRHG